MTTIIFWVRKLGVYLFERLRILKNVAQIVCESSESNTVALARTRTRADFIHTLSSTAPLIRLSLTPQQNQTFRAEYLNKV